MFESKLCHPKMSPFGLKIHLILRNIRFRKSFFLVVVLQSLGRVQLEIPWSAARQLLCPPLSPLVCSKFMSIESVMPSHPVPPPSPFAFNVSQHQGLFQWDKCENSDYTTKYPFVLLISILPCIWTKVLWLCYGKLDKSQNDGKHFQNGSLKSILWVFLIHH